MTLLFVGRITTKFSLEKTLRHSSLWLTGDTFKPSRVLSTLSLDCVHSLQILKFVKARATSMSVQLAGDEEKTFKKNEISTLLRHCLSTAVIHFYSLKVFVL